MTEIPPQCVGCPELKTYNEARRLVSAVLRAQAGRLGVSEDDIGGEILSQGAYEANELARLPGRIRLELVKLTQDFNECPDLSLRAKNFGPYLETVYGTYEPPQFSASLSYLQWRKCYQQPCRDAILALGQRAQGMMTEEGLAELKQIIRDVQTQAVESYDRVVSLGEAHDLATEAMEVLAENCNDGPQGSWLRRRCGSKALK